MSNSPRTDRFLRNTIINGNFEFWQRATTNTFSTGNAGYVADRFIGGAGTGSTVVSQSSDTPSTGAPWSLSIANTTGTFAFMQQRMESNFVRHLANKTVTVVIKVKVTDSSLAPLKVSMSYANSVDSFAGITQIAVVTLAAGPAAGGWVSYSATFTLPAQAINGLVTTVYRDPASAASTTTLYSQLGVYEGTFLVAPSWARAGQDYRDEMQLCQRYYERGFMGSHGVASVSIEIRIFFIYKIQKRATPTISQISGTSLSSCLDQIGINGGFTPGSITGTFGNPSLGDLRFSTSGVAQFSPFGLNSDIFQADAEL